MPQRLVMVLPLISHDGRNGGHGCRVVDLQDGKLVLQVPEYDALDRCGCGRNSAGPEKSGYCSEYKPAKAAEPITAAATTITARQLGAEYVSVPLLVRPELNELLNYPRSSQAGHEDLAGVDAYGPVLPGVIDLDDSVAEITGYGLADYSHVSPNT